MTTALKSPLPTRVFTLCGGIVSWHGYQTRSCGRLSRNPPPHHTSNLVWKLEPFLRARVPRWGLMPGGAESCVPFGLISSPDRAGHSQSKNDLTFVAHMGEKQARQRISQITSGQHPPLSTALQRPRCICCHPTGVDPGAASHRPPSKASERAPLFAFQSAQGVGYHFGL
ncbi:hypothetical protein LZ30DRAFT_318835 [Colletotrichum cereale]|nr:hypothetical protein LZ30DRAFT_318835 [Colletotrichum cereale]